MTPQRSQAFSIDDESLEDYLEFPDPQQYMIGFIYGNRKEKKKEGRVESYERSNIEQQSEVKIQNQN